MVVKLINMAPGSAWGRRPTVYRETLGSNPCGAAKYPSYCDMNGRPIYRILDKGRGTHAHVTETGRRASLRRRCPLWAWEFESPREH